MMSDILKLVALMLLMFTVNVYSQETKINQRPKVGLVLSGGGAKGFAHVGVLKVIEEVGLPVDYIGGTSMGSIIGSLYAIGYSADSIRHIAVTQNWLELFSDRIPRKYLSYEEKQHDGKFFFPIPVTNGRFQLPSGIMPGQNLSMLLSRLMWDADTVTDFKKLPIPFLCIATNIETGKQVLFDKGNLPSAVRASMAIPSVFTPVEENGQFLVDGGLVNNFPVDEVKEMGADIIIGVEVGMDSFDVKRNPGMDKIIGQMLTIFTIDKSLEKRKKCQIYVMPDLADYSISSFDAADSLISIGERYARMQYAAFKHLADSIKNIENNYKHIQAQHLSDTLWVHSIEINGIRNTTRSFVLSRLNLHLPSKLTRSQIEEAVSRVYGSLLYQRVTYQIKHKGNGELCLLVNAFERPQQLFSVGLNYNTEYNASIYINTSFYNVFKKGSKLSINAFLGETPKLELNYLIYSGWRFSMKSLAIYDWRWDLSIKTAVANYKIYSYKNLEKESSLSFTDFTQQVFVQTVFANSYALGFGVNNVFTNQKIDINPFKYPNKTDKFLSLSSYVNLDTYDRIYFPSRGIQLNLTYNYFPVLYKSVSKSFSQITLNYNRSIPITRRLATSIGMNAGTSLGDTIPFNFLYRYGGQTGAMVKNSFAFLGSELMQNVNRNVAIAKMNVQCEIFKKNFIVLKANVGHSSYKAEELLNTKDLVAGYGASYGVLSVLGPAEVTVMYSKPNDFLFYFNVGFSF